MSVVNFKSENAKGDCPSVVVKAGNIGVIVLREWWGIKGDQIKAHGEDISKRGNFTVIIPDLYRGKVATDHETAGHYMNDLDWQGAVKDNQGAAKYLLANGCNKLGVTGFCMGGALSMAGAALFPEIGAAVLFYGIPSAELCTIKIPLQCLFGEKDGLEGFSSPKDCNALKDKLTKAGVKFELFTYDAGHTFTNPTGPLGNYNKDAAELGLNRMAEFLKGPFIKYGWGGGGRRISSNFPRKNEWPPLQTLRKIQWPPLQTSRKNR